jgi:hypothetical protein
MNKAISCFFAVITFLFAAQAASADPVDDALTAVEAGN